MLPFSEIYANLPLAERNRTAAVINSQPLNWNQIKEQVDINSTLGNLALDQLKRLEVYNPEFSSDDFLIVENRIKEMKDNLRLLSPRLNGPAELDKNQMLDLITRRDPQIFTWTRVQKYYLSQLIRKAI